MLLPLLLIVAADLTGLWYGPPTPEEESTKRDIYLALRVEGNHVSGEVETPTRNAPIAEGVLLPDGSFRGVAAHEWDGKPVRRPLQGHLQGDVLTLRIQVWPDGPMRSYQLRRISTTPAIPKLARIEPPPIRDLPANGLARTPPMGWNSWNRFRCKVDDRTIREMADAMVSSGMRDAGYVYLTIDDCWQAGRDGNGNIRPDPQRFPDMRRLTDYIHGKGLKAGIYSSPGPRTCAGFEGSYAHEDQDARQYATWGFDLLKYDWCSATKYYANAEMRPVYQKMAEALRATGRPIVFSLCQYGLDSVWTWGPLAGGNMWRTSGDIGDNWKSIEEIGFVDEANLSPYAGPGHWNDPDVLEVGNGGMNATEYRSHFTLWAMLAAPLLAGNDIRIMTPETRSILLNRDVIAIDQDSLARQAERRWKDGTAEVWARPLADGSWAVAVFNRGLRDRMVRFEWTAIGLPSRPVHGRDLWTGTELRGELSGEFSGAVPAHGVVLWRLR